jgi:putative membrane protein
MLSHKKISIMKKNSLAFLAILCAGVFFSCNNSSDTTTSSDSTTMTTDSSTMSSTTPSADSVSTTTPTSTAPLEKMDKDFVMKAAGGGMMEVELGNIAQQNAASQRVKDFGAMMVRDHSKANDELTAFASRRGVTLNTDSLMNLHKAHIESLKKKTGAAFDKAYMSMMLNDHKKDVAEFEKASKMCKDQECQGWAGKTLPTLQMHLDSAQAINKSL